MQATAPLLPMIAQQTIGEMKARMRNIKFAFAVVLLPAMLYGLFGLSSSGTEGNATAQQFMLASLATYGAINIMLFTFGTSVALERSNGSATLMRAMPVNPIALLIAKIANALVFLAASFALMTALALSAGVTLHVGMLATLFGRLMIGSLPFILLGFALGYLVDPDAAVAVTNIAYLGLAFASGLLAPISQLPHVVQTIAPYLPTYRLGDLAWGAVGANDHSPWADTMWLVVYFVAFGALAIWGYNREEKRSFA